jgi:hypothetical protein
VILSDHGQTQGATFKQRNGYGLDELVERSLQAVRSPASPAATSRRDGQHAVSEATGRTRKKRPKNDVSDREVVVLGSGNLGLVYLMEEKRRLTLEEIDERHPELLRACASTRTIGWLLVRSSEHGAVVLGADRRRTTSTSAASRATTRWPVLADGGRAPARTDGFAHVADIMIGSFYDPMLDEGCAFEELISFHGGLGGLQTRPFILHSPNLPLPDEPIIGAAAVHGLLSSWRAMLQAPPSTPHLAAVPSDPSPAA